jgi:predicted RNA binding protein YcfA (HicA-like mRNA interferase family)
MSTWPSTRARRVLAALLRIGWYVKAERGGSHKVLARSGWTDQVWSYHDGAEVGPKILARVGKRTGLRPEDL